LQPTGGVRGDRRRVRWRRMDGGAWEDERAMWKGRALKRERAEAEGPSALLGALVHAHSLTGGPSRRP